MSISLSELLDAVCSEVLVNAIISSEHDCSTVSL